MSDTAKPTRPYRCRGGCRGATIDTAVSWRLTRLCKKKRLLADMAVSSTRWLPLSMAIDTAVSEKRLFADTAVSSPRWLPLSYD